MTMSSLFIPAGAFALGALATFAITPLTARLARRLQILDVQDVQSHKRHEEATPYLGGVAIFGGLVAVVPLLWILRPGFSLPILNAYVPIVLVAFGLGLFGLLDDIRTLPRWIRLLAQVAAAVAAWSFGFAVEAFQSDPLNFALTVIWIVGITNAFNLLDNMDGLSAGLAGVSALSFAALGALGQLTVLTMVSAGIAGASIGFLAHNRHPAKIFMGDAGSLFLGFMLAVIGLRLEFNNLLQVTFFIPVVVLGVPIFDTTLVVITRLRHKRSVFLGGRDHLSHRLVHVGLSVKTAVGLIYWAGLCLGWLGLVISRSNTQVAWMLLAFVCALGVFFGLLLGRVPVYEEEPGFEEIQDEDAIDPDELVETASG